jgi:CelD/BcsL family acetyltransferase involved in cellulose biosynthesis
MLDRGGKFSTIISAIDDSVGNAYAPGLILFTKIFERAIEAGYVFGDMGVGCMHYKTRFASRQNPLFIWERALSLQGMLALVALNAARRAKRWAKQNDRVRTLVGKILRRQIATPVGPAKVDAPDED